MNGVRDKINKGKTIALRGNRTPGGSKLPIGNDPGYHYPINALYNCYSVSDSTYESDPLEK